MCVGRFKSFGYGRSRCLKITECKNDQHIGGISGTPTLINKAEFVVIFKAAVQDWYNASDVVSRGGSARSRPEELDDC